MNRAEIQRQVAELGPWFHNLELGGVMTAPAHFLGDYPRQKWKRFQHAIPSDLRGKTVLDIGCNAGFYSLEMKRRGAKAVVAIDTSDLYLAQARFASKVTGIEIDVRKLDTYDVAELGTKFDIVLFMGVLYHLRHPLLALDLIHEHVVGDTMIFQSMQRGSHDVLPLTENYPFSETEIFDRAEYPKMHFVENRYSGDETNWWIPNRACVEAMLRSSGFRIETHPEEEVYVCRVEGGER
ncbi:MAG: methyltransferase, TIGR04290 family [Myxococcales bacterium 68-20]|nr:MAG: methyltransferase, TIGR04290 family [Myxococcales bacterium 68-20]